MIGREGELVIGKGGVPGAEKIVVVGEYDPTHRVMSEHPHGLSSGRLLPGGLQALCHGPFRVCTCQ